MACIPRDWYTTQASIDGNCVTMTFTKEGVRGLVRMGVDQLARSADISVTISGRKFRLPRFVARVFVRLWWMTRGRSIEARAIADCLRHP